MATNNNADPRSLVSETKYYLVSWNGMKDGRMCFTQNTYIVTSRYKGGAKLNIVKAMKQAMEQGLDNPIPLLITELTKDEYEELSNLT